MTRPRRRLPQRVYWFRRVLVLAVAFGLVFGIGRLLGGDPAEDAGPSARPASGTVTAGSPGAVSTADAAPARKGRKSARPTRSPLPEPSGPCQDSDVRVTPRLGDTARAGGDVRFVLALTTFESPACTWRVGPDTIAVRLTSGSDRIWTSQDCPAVIAERDVVLRTVKATPVEIVWPGRRSDEDCSRNTMWAEPGYYHVSAAALGSEPTEVQFELRAPAPVTNTPTPSPTRKARQTDEAQRRGGASGTD